MLMVVIDMAYKMVGMLGVVMVVAHNMEEMLLW